MTPELTWLLALLAAGIVAVVLGVYWWMQRDPVGERPEELPPLPLFGSSTGGDMNTPPDSRPAVGATAPMLFSPKAAGPTADAPARSPSEWSAPSPLPPVVPFRAPATPSQAASQITPPRGTPAPNAPAPSAPAPSAPAPHPPVLDDSATPARPRPIIREFSTAISAAPGTGTDAASSAPSSSVEPATYTPSGTPVVNDAGVPGTMVEGHALRFSVPAEGTLQFLPGRFEIGSGLDAGREIRFVHVPGPYAMNVTFGRSGGELYRHIQLRDKTVSRRHARMQLRDGRWYLTNLSATNPVVWNGTELANEQEQPLGDGDRVEMGEVLFTFRSR